MKKYCSRLTTCIVLAVVLGLIVAMEPTTGLGQNSTEQQDPWSAYKVIVERNMFSRQRGTRAERFNRDGSEMRTPPPTPNPESYYVLKGIVKENDAFIGFLEDARGGQILRVRKGDSVARGVIKALSLDSIDYQLEDRTITIRMGQDLEGGQGALTMTQLLEQAQTYSVTPPEGAASAPGESIPSAEEADILRKLMERRQQQLGQ